MKVGVSNSAFGDLKAIVDYYTKEGVPDVGRQFIEAIIERIQVLSDHPDMGREVPEFLSIDIRAIIHEPFRVFYLREENPLQSFGCGVVNDCLYFPMTIRRAPVGFSGR